MKFRIRSQSQTVGHVGKVFLSLFLSIFLFAGLFFVYLVGQDVARTFDTHGWMSLPCRILTSRVDVRPPGYDVEKPYVFHTEYTYQVNGTTYPSETYRDNYRGDGDYAAAQQRQTRWPIGLARCWVDPANPAQSLLEPRPRWTALLLLLPLVFVAVGGGGIVLTWRTWKPNSISKHAISNHPTTGRGRQALMVMGVIFFVAGSVASFFFFVQPAIGILAARHWRPTPCVIESSEVRSHRSDDGTTYSVDILYRYTVHGQTYRSSRYHFLTGSSSGYQGKRDVVNHFPVGVPATCFVDPADPTQAVLQPKASAGFWFGALTLIFVFAGLGMLYGAWRMAGDHAGRKHVWLPKRQTSDPTDSLLGASHPSGATILKAKHRRWTTFLVILLFAVVWNGFIGAWVVQITQEHAAHRGSWFQTLFAVPFVLVGLGVGGAVVYHFLAMFNPTVQITIDQTAISLGGSFTFHWQLNGRVRRLRRFRIELEGKEQATYRRGTDTVTDTHVFATHWIVDTGDRSQLSVSAGKGQITVPTGTMHSFDASSNKIIWSLKAIGDIPYWPDVNDTFPMTVLPHGFQASSNPC